LNLKISSQVYIPESIKEVHLGKINPDWLNLSSSTRKHVWNVIQIFPGLDMEGKVKRYVPKVKSESIIIYNL